MKIAELRAKHPVFHYERAESREKSGTLTLTFSFFLEPDIRFQPVVSIPVDRPVDHARLEPFVFSLGMIEAVSYWKAACAPVLSVEAGPLNSEQIAWWYDLFLRGLGEFFFKNTIDFTAYDFLTIRSGSALQQRNRRTTEQSSNSGDLILIGGGKDSAVTAELTRGISDRRNALLLNPTPAALAVTRQAGFERPLIARRTIDPKLLRLNKQGYLNGHTPFSAYLAFLGVLVGELHGYTYIIASNEESASAGNTTFHGMEINHQYSKSCAFEKKFREYCQKFLPNAPNYFSLLRPLNELAIGKLFSGMEPYFTLFKSCNLGRGARWCGTCAKCAFVYLILSPFLPTEEMVAIFGADYFSSPRLRKHMLDLAGLGAQKPFECVGTPEETKEAIRMTLAKYAGEGRALPPTLAFLKEKLNMSADGSSPKITPYWNKNHFLPKAYESLLRRNNEYDSNPTE
ncbi:hypothetical protein M1555_04435 [Patescibacteria group bacterium]|nr:hypothetical protein [Patescibacteria group bacterium]